MRTVKVITLCSGYDAQCLALRRAAIPFDLVAWSDIDPVAINAHDALFPEYSERNLGDMTKIKWQDKGYDDIDLLTYSTPCTDISVAGGKRGFEEGSGTRSSVLWHTRKAIRELKPKYLLQENVKTITTGKMRTLFDKWCSEVSSLGYNNYWQILDAADYGVPQRRNRLYMISIRKDIDRGGYNFPSPRPLQCSCYDYLDDIYKTRLKSIGNQTSCLNYNDYENGYVGIRCIEYRAYDVRGVYPCVTTSFLPLLGIPFDACPEKCTFPRIKGIDRVGVDQSLWQVRYPTNKEVLRLMDLLPHEADLILNSGLSRGDIVQVAGNSIVVSVLAEIFKLIWHKNGLQLTIF